MYYGGIFDWESTLKKLEQIETQIADPHLWDDPQTAQKNLKEREFLSQGIKRIQDLEQNLQDYVELLKLGEQEQDIHIVEEAEQDLQDLKRKAARMRLESLLSGEADANDWSSSLSMSLRLLWLRKAPCLVRVKGSLSELLGSFSEATACLRLIV